tara:strand:- start:590 stop:715 length:126 start_codon:yes stop_codon:yes gene_type:complete
MEPITGLMICSSFIIPFYSYVFIKILNEDEMFEDIFEEIFE